MKLFVLPLADPLADLATVGGKGMSLAKLAQAQLPVPEGFHITTEAYRRFVADNDLEPRILKALERVDVGQPSSLETAAQVIARLFAGGTIPPEIAEAICTAYASLPTAQTSSQPPAVAVRSSATAEDLPGASFAGQQDTYLNICGPQAVLVSVQKCWGSLWTGRAIAYRLHQGILPESVTLAVVVQQLVPAEAAGILFTANPLTGRRSEALINAAWGLGEAIVSGKVTPDSITVERSTGRVVQRETAQKQVMTVRSEHGVQEEPVPIALKNKAVLNDRQAAALAGFGDQVEELYGMPMDIEWALVSGRFAILQARPITTLGEAPLEWKPPKAGGVYMRGGVVDLMPNPLSPLFITLGIPAMITQMFSLIRVLFHTEPAFPEDYFTTINTYAYLNGGLSARGWLWVVFSMLPAFPRLLSQLVPFWREQARPQYQKVVATWQDQELELLRTAELWQAAQVITDAAANYTGALMFATMGASAGSEGLLTQVYDKLARHAGDPPATTLLMGWDSSPIRAEKSLYSLAEFCREHEPLQAYILQTSSGQLSQHLVSDLIPNGISGEDWLTFCQRFEAHLQQFGHMIFELDFARPLPRDHPEPILEAIKMYLRGEGANPFERQKASEERRIRTSQQVLGRLKGIRRWAFSKTLNWAQSLSEIREDALADIGLGYPALRRILHLLGEHFVKAGALQEAWDIFWLEKEEVDQSVAGLQSGTVLKSLLAQVNQRKIFWQKAKQSAPPPMLPPRKKYMGINTSVWLPEAGDSQTGDMLKGVPASPGRVTAPARLLHGPEDFDRMRPGEVLVAGTTTPAWTPLFAMASAVVTDIGGPLSHGSIVAREYGIPAVMGTGMATHRITDGQIVTVDGEAGTVTLA